MRVKLSFKTPEFAIAIYVQRSRLYNGLLGTLPVVGTAGSAVSAVTTEQAGAVAQVDAAIRLTKRKLR